MQLIRNGASFHTWLYSQPMVPFANLTFNQPQEATTIEIYSIYSVSILIIVLLREGIGKALSITLLENTQQKYTTKDSPTKWPKYIYSKSSLQNENPWRIFKSKIGTSLIFLIQIKWKWRKTNNVNETKHHNTYRTFCYREKGTEISIAMTMLKVPHCLSSWESRVQMLDKIRTENRAIIDKKKERKGEEMEIVLPLR